MRPRLLVSATLLALLAARPAFAQEVKDLADVMPARVLAYAELRQPGMIAREIASLFEGSALGNVPDSLAKVRGPQGGPSRSYDATGMLGVLLSPEVVGEVRRLRGAAFALTGFKRGEPEWVAVVLPGESNLPAFALRMLLAAEGRPAGEVEGVTLYHVSFSGRALAPAPAGPRADAPRSPVFALMPGALLAGSPDGVKGAIRRIKGADKEKGLAGAKLFQEANETLGGRAGLFAYYEPAALVAAVEKDLLPPEAAREAAPVLGAIKEVVNLKAIRAAVYGLTLEEGTLRYSETALLDPKEKLLPLELLPREAVNKELLHFTPDGAVLAAAMSNDHGQQRWERGLKLVDSFFPKGQGEERKLPSEYVAAVEKALDVSLGKDVFGAITGVGVALGDPMKAPKKRLVQKGPGFEAVRVYTEVPLVFVVRADGEEAAKKLVGLLPKVVGLLSGEGEARSEARRVGGQEVVTLKGRRPADSFHYGRQGRTIVLGQYPEPVAQALGNGAGGKGWATAEKVQQRLGKLDDTVAVGVMKPFALIMSALMVDHVHEMRKSETKPAVRPERKDAAPPPAAEKPAPPPEPVPVKADPQSERLQKEMGRLLEDEGLMTMRLTRRPERVRFEAEWPGLKPVVARLTDFYFEQLLKERREARPDRPPQLERPRPSKDK